MKHVVIHPKDFLNKEREFNDRLAVAITKAVGSMVTAYFFTVLALFSLPAVLVGVFPGLSSDFPSWLLKASLISLVAWVAQTFLQLVLLPIIIVGQNVIQAQNDTKADVDHKNLVMLVTLQEEQMEILERLDKLTPKSDT